MRGEVTGLKLEDVRGVRRGALARRIVAAGRGIGFARIERGAVMRLPFGDVAAPGTGTATTAAATVARRHAIRRAVGAGALETKSGRRFPCGRDGRSEAEHREGDTDHGVQERTDELIGFVAT